MSGMTVLVSLAGLLPAWSATCVILWVFTRKAIASIHGHAPWSWWVLAGYEAYISHLPNKQTPR